MKRDYPLFLIDRRKLRSYPFDYIICMDAQLGFIAKVVPFFQDQPFLEFIERSSKIQDSEYTSVTYKFKKQGGLIVVIEDFLYQIDWTNDKKTRIKVLLKKALKSYLHAEVDRAFDKKDLSLGNQIKQQESTIERAKSNYEGLIDRVNGDKEFADYQIALAEATLESLKTLYDNQQFFKLNLN